MVPCHVVGLRGSLRFCSNTSASFAVAASASLRSDSTAESSSWAGCEFPWEGAAASSASYHTVGSSLPRRLLPAFSPATAVQGIARHPTSGLMTIVARPFVVLRFLLRYCMLIGFRREGTWPDACTELPGATFHGCLRVCLCAGSTVSSFGRISLLHRSFLLSLCFAWDHHLSNSGAGRNFPTTQDSAETAVFHDRNELDHTTYLSLSESTS